MMENYTTPTGVPAAAYARSIIMDSYKRISGNECYYTDTDSVFLENP